MKLALGTVQFGQSYGISNRQGQTPLPEVRPILELAHQRGIGTLDTASLYGESQAVLGEVDDLAHDHAFEKALGDLKFHFMRKALTNP